jgi:hypothetical protein
MVGQFNGTVFQTLLLQNVFAHRRLFLYKSLSKPISLSHEAEILSNLENRDRKSDHGAYLPSIVDPFILLHHPFLCSLLVLPHLLGSRKRTIHRVLRGNAHPHPSSCWDILSLARPSTNRQFRCLSRSIGRQGWHLVDSPGLVLLESE